MCDVCGEFLHLLVSYELRLIGNDSKNLKVERKTTTLQKHEVEIALGYIQTWPQRQCMCCYRDIKNFERFNLIVQGMIYLAVLQLKNIQTLVAALKPPNPTSNNNNNDSNNVNDTNDTVEKKDEDSKNDSQWTLKEVEQLLILISKAFLLNFPLYIAYKHGVHSRLDDISAQEAQSLSMFCDLHDSEIPAFLLRNVTLFCNTGGLSAMMACFELPNLPVSTAHAITAAVSNLKLWLNYRSVVQMFVPLRVKVLQYMCKLADQDLRSPATRSMADFMWAAIKDPLDTQIAFDTEGLALAFKYFTSTTLTMRLAGMAQINAHINLFNEICTSETVAEVEIVGQKLADWLTEYQIISHLFGPNLHAEVIKQSHIVLNFLAVENQINEEHINLIWQAAQLKHCSKPIYDILPSLVKNLVPQPALHLYSLLCRLDPKEHTEQSIYITSALTKLIWSRDGSRQPIELPAGVLAHVPSSSENSVSIDGSNSEEEHPDEDSSDGQKSIVIEFGSDSGPTPCKQPRHKPCCDETTDDSSKIEEIDIDCTKLKTDVGRANRRLVSVMNASSSDDCLDLDDVGNYALRKKMRKRRKVRVITKKQLQNMEPISDGESQSEGVIGINESDCSDTHIQSSMLGHPHGHTDGPFLSAISDLLSGAENDGYSSPLSNKSEKNMADFEDEDEDDEVCDEEMEHLAAQFASRDIIREHFQTVAKSNRNASCKVMDKVIKDQKQQLTYRVAEVCQPGNTLLWDLLMDDKIGQLGESLALEAEKALGTLLCFNTEKMIRTKFIEGCLQNLASNRSVIVSLRLLPKLFASFQQFRAIDTHQVTMWAEEVHNMMTHFFNNLKFYANSTKNQNQGQVLNQSGGLMYSHLTQVQVRLQFLSSVFSTMGSPDSFRLSLEQVDALWEWLANDSECSDCLFAWLQGQAKGADQHALGIDTLQHLYLKKLPELKPEGISMVALGLFQQLCSLARLAAAHYDTDSSMDIVGMSHLWKIALRASNTDCSLAAIQYINSYYMGQQLKLEKEFVAHCMNHLKQASEDLNSTEYQENALMCVQRALMLLNTHLDTFRRRYAYHLRRWALEGKSFGSHSALRNDGLGPQIRVVLQPNGLSEKSVLHLHTSDLVADLKAEIGKWWETLQGGAKSSGATAPVLGLLLSEGPLRIITQGQEITSEYDERSLSDVGFKDNQMVYVSLGSRGGRRRDPADHPSLQPPPPKECLPTVLLLQPKYFEELFQLMQTLGDMKLPTKRGCIQPHTKAQLLSRRVWDILAMLPTNPDILNKFKNVTKAFQTSGNDVASEKVSPDPEYQQQIQELLHPNNLQKFMYSLHIVESLSKTKPAGCCGNESNLKTIPPKSKSNHKQPHKQKTPKVDKATEECSADTIKDVTKVSGDEETASSKEPTDVDKNNPTESKATKIQDGDGNNKVQVPEPTVRWTDAFIKCGGLRHLFDIFMSGMLQSEKGVDDCNEWRNDCLASLLRILCLLGVDEMKPDDSLPVLNETMMKMMIPEATLKRLSSILNDAGLPTNPHHFKTGFWGRSQVIHFTMNLLVCLVHSSAPAREYLWSDPDLCGWLQRFILDDPEPAVRREACAGLYRICLGNNVKYDCLMEPLVTKLIGFLPIAEKMVLQHSNPNYSNDDGKEPYGPACRDYFWLLCRLVEKKESDSKESQSTFFDIEALCRQVADCILKRDFLETRYGNQDDGLVGLLNLITNLMKRNPQFKFSHEAEQFISEIFDCLFDLPSPQNRQKPKCKSQSARLAAYDLLVELCRKCPKNFTILHGKLMDQHRPGPHSAYPWDYWPRDDGRSECGYVGLTNLGATCYMASCIQHLFMMPQAREAILKIGPQTAQKHESTLLELQRMFAYLMESERKSYNPRSFCRVYQMDHQPLNTGEQKDMAEFFIDLVSKLEEMTPDLKTLIKRLFCGTQSNNVVSLDCGHVSRTLEEFYTVRCQVADMRNLHESLDEVTVKDTLEGDNMYTCSQCGRKVRAEKRACFKKLPQILCFNTMRYTFNMLTMLKEKVNTHFSFPMRLDMSGYMEKQLMPQQYQEGKRKTEESTAATVDEVKVDGTGNESDKQSKSAETDKPNIGEDVTKQEESATQKEPEKDDSNEFEEHYEYDLVGVTVHTGTADGGHYYSFIKERNSFNGQQDRWFLFNDAEVKIFDPSQIAAECFGGEMISKTYDPATEKYLDFSFEKTNSAYMLFYERRSSKIDEEPTNSEGCEPSEQSLPIASCSSNQSAETELQSKSIPTPIESTTSDQVAIEETESNIELTNSNLAHNKCDIDSKGKGNATASQSKRIANVSESSPSSSSSITKRTSLLCKDLEEWIWQDNRHFLQDRNIFEHTYFNFMSQICGHIPQKLQTDVTCIAAQLSVSFFIETFIHAKEKPTMVLWVELLTKQFNASQEACEWFLTHMSTEPWWPVQVLIQCPNQMVRQMFQRLVIHVIQQLRPTHFGLYLKTECDDDDKETIGNASCVTRFIKSLIILMEHGAKPHLRHLSEFFELLYNFSRMGEEEGMFLLKINVIRSVADFYLGHKTQDCLESTSDNDDNSSDEALSIDKTRPASLDKMIALVASLVERSRGADLRLNLATRDYNAIAGGKGFPFLYQQIKDNINPHQTRHLIHALCRWDERLANQIISMLFTTVTKHTELCGPFFKLLTLLTESSSGPSGLPCFSQLVLQRVWDAAEYCPQSALDWLAVQAPRNKIAHAWILQSAENWVEQFLLAHNNSRVRNAAAYLLISLVPSQSFRANYRTSSLKIPIQTSQRELSGDALIILHTILSLLLRLLRQARAYTDISVHGTGKLTAYFSLMTYCMITKTEKLMLGPFLRSLWELFHPRLSEPSVPAHHNKQALLAFWYHATNDCPENALIMTNCPEITRNIAFNYILADHDDTEIVAYNRAMLPAYYGLLRLCCMQSRTLTRQLAAHQNLQWAFKNITSHPTQYSMAVDELFRLMTLFAARHPDATETEQRDISSFRRTTLTAYLSGLDSRVSWGTVIAALRILVDNDEDRLFVVFNGGIAMCFEALHTLHSMYHEATACHVSGDLQELLTELVLLVSALRINSREQKKRPPSGALKGLPEAVRRLATLCNTFNPPEMRNLSLEVLKELVRNSNLEVTNILAPLFTNCHVQAQSSPNSIGFGPYFPRRGTKIPWPSVSKNNPRPPRPMVQMSIPQSQILQKGVDKDFDSGLDAFYRPYHDFLDVMFRMAVNTNQLNDSLVSLSCLAGIEGAPLHFNLFPKFWVGIYNNKNTNKYAELLINNPYLIDYVDVIVKDERISLNDPIITNFMEIYFPKATSKIQIPRLLDSICQVVTSKENYEDLCGDLLTICVIVQAFGIPTTIRGQLLSCLNTIKTRFKEEFEEDESPPKKRKLNPEQPASSASSSSASSSTSSSTSSSSSPSSSSAALNIPPITSNTDDVASSASPSSETPEQSTSGKVVTSSNASVKKNEPDNKDSDSTMSCEMVTATTTTTTTTSTSSSISGGKQPLIDEVKERSVERNILKKIEFTLMTILKYFDDDSCNSSFEAVVVNQKPVHQKDHETPPKKSTTTTTATVTTTATTTTTPAATSPTPDANKSSSTAME